MKRKMAFQEDIKFKDVVKVCGMAKFPSRPFYFGAIIISCKKEGVGGYMGGAYHMQGSCVRGHGKCINL